MACLLIGCVSGALGALEPLLSSSWSVILFVWCVCGGEFVIMGTHIRPSGKTLGHGDTYQAMGKQITPWGTSTCTNIVMGPHRLMCRHDMDPPLSTTSPSREEDPFFEYDGMDPDTNPLEGSLYYVLAAELQRAYAHLSFCPHPCRHVQLNAPHPAPCSPLVFSIHAFTEIGISA